MASHRKVMKSSPLSLLPPCYMTEHKSGVTTFLHTFPYFLYSKYIQSLSFLIPPILRIDHNAKKDTLRIVLQSALRLSVWLIYFISFTIYSFASIRLSFLHFGQNNGKCVRTVSSRNRSLVLFPQTGQ